MDRTAKPLLILPPAPARRAALEDLLLDARPAARADLCRRLAEPPPGSRDAVAIVPDGGRALAAACIARRYDVGVLTSVFTRKELRLRGHARRLLQTLLAWFDTTGGRWLFAVAPPELLAPIFEPFGFRVLHRGAEAAALVRTLAAVGDEPFLPPARWHGARIEPHGPTVRLPGAAGEEPSLPAARWHDPPGRVSGAVGEEPYPRPGGEDRLEGVSRADWPLLFGLMQFAPGPDPRVPLAESAPAAETASLELLDQQDRGACVLRGAWSGRRLLAAGSLATDPLGTRSFGALIPPDGPAALRADLVSLAASRGYTQVDFPFELLAG